MNMLPLDSPRWKELQAPGCDISEVINLLRQLGTDSRREALDELGSVLCANSDIHSGSYAAVPHLIAAAEREDPSGRSEYLFVLGAVAAWGPLGPGAPKDIYEDFEKSLERGTRMAFESLRPGLSQSDVISLLVVLCAIRGRPRVARRLESLLQDDPKWQEVSGECPSCGESVNVYPQEGHFFAEGRNPTRSPQAKRTKVKTLEPLGPNPDISMKDLVPEGLAAWLPQLAIKAGRLSLARTIRSLFGTVECPLCGHEFVVLEEIGQ
jgi:hypothetical protein